MPESPAAARREHRELGRRQLADELLELSERVGVELVVRPASLTTVGHEPGVLEHLEVEGEPGLAGVERLGEVADAALPFSQHVDDLEARLVGERLELA